MEPDSLTGNKLEFFVPEDEETAFTQVAERLRRFHGRWTQFDKQLTHRQARLDRWTTQMAQSKNTLREFKTFVDQTQSQMASR